MIVEIEYFKAKKPQDKKINTKNVDEFQTLLDLHGGVTAAENKYDGYGIIIDTRNPDVDLRSLSLSQWDPRSLPEIDFSQLPRGLYVGELVGTPTHDGFTNLDEFAAVRARSLDRNSPKNDKLVETNPLEVRLYDIVEMENELIGRKPNCEVRPTIENICQAGNILPTARQIIDNSDELMQAANATFKAGKEGFVIKDLNSSYLNKKDCTSRNSDWLKIKKALTVDGVILGLYQTKERMAQGFACSNALLGAYNSASDMFETLTKVNMTSAAMAEEFTERLGGKLNYSWSEESPFFWENNGISPSHDSNVVYSPNFLRGKPANKIPHLYVENPRENSFVVEVKAMDVTSPKTTVHSCGLADGSPHSLRQPVFSRYRDDKTPLQATTTEQLHNY